MSAFYLNTSTHLWTHADVTSIDFRGHCRVCFRYADSAPSVALPPVKNETNCYSNLEPLTGGYATRSDLAGLGLRVTRRLLD